MALFLKIVSGIYLLMVWLVFATAIRAPLPASFGSDNVLFGILAFVMAVSLSIPAVVLYAFGQMVGELRTIRQYSRLQAEHLKAIRAYYEPHGH